MSIFLKKAYYDSHDCRPDLCIPLPRINVYAGTGPTEEQYKRVTIPMIRGGLFYKNDWINLTSMVTYISKSNNIDQQNLTAT